MKQHEKKRLLNEEGFLPVRMARHGVLYQNANGDRILLPRPGTKDPNADKNWLQSLRRIKKKIHA
jgi:hypothetical protein